MISDVHGNAYALEAVVREIGAAATDLVSSGVSLVAGALPAITFWVPPTSISVSKQGGWGQPDQVPDAIGSGPPEGPGSEQDQHRTDY